MTTKQEALKKLDELEEKVDEKLASEKALRLGAEKEVDNLRKANEDIKHQAEAEYRRAENLLKERDRLQYTLNGYGDLGKALAKIRGDSVDPEAVRKIVQEEVAKLPVGSNPTESGVQVTESVPYVDLKISRPWLTLDESTLAGMITVLALKDKLPKKFGFGDVAKALEFEYSWKLGGGSQRRRLQEALDELVGKYKTIERKLEDNQWVYQLKPDTRSRVKESETREPVARAKEIS